MSHGRHECVGNILILLSAISIFRSFTATKHRRIQAGRFYLRQSKQGISSCVLLTGTNISVRSWKFTVVKVGKLYCFQSIATKQQRDHQA